MGRCRFSPTLRRRQRGVSREVSSITLRRPIRVSIPSYRSWRLCSRRRSLVLISVWVVSRCVLTSVSSNAICWRRATSPTNWLTPSVRRVARFLSTTTRCWRISHRNMWWIRASSLTLWVWWAPTSKESSWMSLPRTRFVPTSRRYLPMWVWRLWKVWFLLCSWRTMCWRMRRSVQDALWWIWVQTPLRWWSIRIISYVIWWRFHWEAIISTKTFLPYPLMRLRRKKWSWSMAMLVRSLSLPMRWNHNIILLPMVVRLMWPPSRTW